MNTTEVLILLNAGAVIIGMSMVASALLIIHFQVIRGREASQALKDFLAAELEASRNMEH